MIEAALLVVAMYAALCVVGWCVLAPVDRKVRARLLPALPVFGAAVIAAISSTATRWLTMPQTGLVVLVVLAGILLVAARRGRLTWRVPRRALVNLVLCPVLTVCGAAVVAAPTAWVGDSRPVASTIIIDQFYFASNSTYLTDQPMLPGPYWNPGDWVGSATPSSGPVVDVISNRLRYGQASVSSLLSYVVGQEPSDTVTPISIMWLIVIGGAVFVAASLLGARRRWALAAVPLVSSSFFLTSQVLEGKNDGILGVSLALVALALSYAVMRRTAFVWPLVVIVAGLAATYSELVLVLAAPVALLSIVGTWRGLLARVNVVAGTWALGAVLTPWAWVWLAQSAAIGGRFSEGATPFDDRRGLALLRVVLGMQPASSGALQSLFTVVAVIVLAAAVAGVVGAVVLSPVRGAAIGLLLTLAWLEYSAISSDAGNLKYRTAQLGYAFVLVVAVVGWDALLRALPRRDEGALRRVVPAVATALVVVVVGSFVATNTATAASHLPRDRAELQHVPKDELTEAASWVREVGPSEVAVVIPRFVDLAWLALEMRDVDDVAYPVLPAIYLGTFPRWDREPDRYVLLGAGATFSGDVTVLHENSRYQLVELGETGMVLTPYQPTYFWGRTTYMRGVPCVRDSAQMLLLRGSQARGTFAVASQGRTTVPTNLVLDVDGVPIAPRAEAEDVDGWNVQQFAAPRFRSAIINIHRTRAVRRAGTTALPLVFGGEDLATDLTVPDPHLRDFCLADEDDGMDGYDRDVTLLRTAP